jgi:hypothetical protein
MKLLIEIPNGYRTRLASYKAGSIVDNIIRKAVRNGTIVSDDTEPEPRYALVTHYSFDETTPVWLFTSEDKAKTELKSQFDEEIRIEIEENKRSYGSDLETFIDPSGIYAYVKVKYADGDEGLTEWSVSQVENKIYKKGE